MKIKLFLFASLTVFLSSCCWLIQDDYAENSKFFTIPVSINHTDRVLNLNYPLGLVIESSRFQNVYDDNNSDSFSLYIT